MKKIILILVLLITHYTLLITPIGSSLVTPVYAQVDCNDGETATDLGCIPNTPGAFTTRIYGIGLGLISGVALFFIIVGGYLILSSKGDPAQLQRGRSYIISSVVGIILAISGFAVYQIITVDALKLPGFTR